MSYLRTTSLIALSSVTVLLAACQKSETAPAQAAAPASSQGNELKTLSIGFQKSSLNSIVLKQQHLLEKEFPNTPSAQLTLQDFGALEGWANALPWKQERKK